MNSFARLVMPLAASTLLNAHSHAQVVEAWAAQVPVGSGSPPINLLVQPTGHLHLFGWSQTDSSTAKLDPNGSVLWSRRFDSNLTTLNFPIDQVVDGAGNVYVACNDNSSAPQISQVALLKYAGDGALLWTRFLPGTNAGSVSVNQLALDSQGRVIIAAVIYNAAGDSDFLTLKCDANGAVLWSARYDEGLHETPYFAAADPADNVYLVGSISDLRAGPDLIVVKYAANGQQLWVARYDNPAHGSDFPVAVHVDSAGNVYVSGYSHANPSHPNLGRLEVVKFGASGQLLWSAHYSGAPREFLQATTAALDGSGNLFVGGLAYDLLDNSGDMVLAKFDASGNREWVARYNGPRRSTESARGLALDSLGNVYLTGDSQEGSDTTNPHATSYFTQKFDPSGNRLWSISRPSDASFYNYPGGVGLDAAGGVYIAGRFLNVTNYEDSGWLAVKYNQTPAPGLPSIVSPPAGQTVPPSSTAAFTVTASGDAPLSYQWRYNGRVVVRATNATLALSNVQFAQRGGYSVDVSNAVGVVATAEAELVVLEPPTFTQQPSSQTAFLGTETAFTAAVTGLDPFSYQWRHDGANLPGATNATLTLFNVQPEDTGGYSVLVGNIAGSITSQVAVLTVSTQVMRSWTARYDGPAQAIELNPLLALDGTGLPVVTVTSQGPLTDFDFATLKHDLAGTRLWAARFNSESNRADYATALFIDASGNVYVTGHSLGGERQALTTAKYDAAGQLLWSAMTTHHEWRTDIPCVITADSVGNVYLAASAAGNVWVFKYDVSGNEVWIESFRDNNDAEARAIAVDDLGNACLAVREVGYNNPNFLLLKLDSNGQRLWLARYDSDDTSTAIDTLFGMGRDAVGNIYLAGHVYDPSASGGSVPAVVKFDPDGNRVWVARHRSSRYTTPLTFVVNPAGASWLAYVSAAPGGEGKGEEEPTDAFNAVVHFDPDGRERWVSIPTRADFGNLHGLAADNAGNAYASGTRVRDGSGSDLAASRIDPNGNLLWTALYNGPANSQDSGSAIAVGPTGDIFVAGTSGNEFGLPDVVLLKYRENPLPGLPAIATPPNNVVIRLGSDVTLAVTASGAAPLRYQWSFNGTPLTAATNAFLTVRAVDDGDVGFYAVEVSNPVGVVRSAAARLEAIPPPVIVQQPVGQSSVIGAEAYFTVRAGGVGPLTYQWLLNGVPIAGATNMALVLENLQAAQAGNYSVLIGDAAGAVSSQSARLSVSLVATKCEQWDYFTAEPNSIGAALIARDSAGNFYVAGTAWLTNDNEADFLVLKYASNGQILWQASHDFAGDRDLATAIAVDASDNVIVTGVSYQTGSGFNSDYATVKFGPQGNKLWARSYSGPIEYDVAQGVATDQNGNVYVTGWSQWGDGLDYRTAYLTVKYGPDGTQLWTAEHRGPADASAYAIAVDAAGDIYVTGTSYDGTGQGDIATIKYNPSGNELWIARWEQAHGGGSGLTFDGAGHLIVVGYSLTPGRAGIVTINYDTNGNERWSAHSSANAGAASVLRKAAVDAAGNIVVAGEIGGDLVTLKYDRDGHQLWSARWGGPRASEDSVRDLALDAAGNAYVTGFSRDVERGYPDLVIIKYSPAGTRLWLAFKFEVSGADMVLDGGGNVYVILGTAQGVSLLKYCQSDVPGIPVIHEQPQSQDVITGTNVMFSVVASGASPLGYQWHFNGQVIPGATSATLLLSNVLRANAGNYTVEVFNSLGSVVSADATLAVHVPATILSPPIDDCVIAGGVARFRVTAAGESPITYQWSFGAQEIPGATNATLLVSNVQLSQVGIYTVRVSNPFGSETASASLSLLPNVQQLWARTFSNSAPALGVPDTDDLATVSTLDSAGNLYIAGVSIPPYSNPYSVDVTQEIFTLKYDTNGTLQWAARHASTRAGPRRATDIAVNAVGEVHVALEEYNNTNAPALLKYSASGQLLWTARFPGAGHPSARALALDAAGNAYVIELTYRLMKVSPNGTPLWTAVRPQAAAAELTVDDASNIYVTGFAFAPGSGQPTGRGADYLTVKYNTAGVEQWSRTFRGPIGEDNEAYLIAVDSAGNVIVSGFHFVQRLQNYSSGFNVGTFKYDPNGNILWFADYGDTNTMDSPTALKLDAAGNVFITGFSENFEGRGRRGWTLKYGAGGELQWAREFGSDPNAAETPALGVDAAGNAYASGALREESNQPIITTIKYGPTGDELWTARFRDSGFSGVSYGTFVQGVHVDTGGRVLVVGSIGDRMRDVVALAYAPLASSDAPMILSQPQNVIVPFRGMAQFSVTASNALRFQWQLNGRDLPGATNAILIVPVADLEDEGYYAVRIENDTYCIFSRAAQLTLDVPTPVLVNPHIYERYFYCTAVVTPGRSYRLEGSSDLMNWTLVAQQPAYGRTITFNDSASPWQEWRFYRVVQDP